MGSNDNKKSFKPTITMGGEDRSIVIEDDFAANTYDFYPESKQFRRVMSVKDDCFYIHEINEYRINQSPITVSIRLLEKSTEPPQRFEVKDGVVLESEILKNGKFLHEDRIDDLKKEVEWHEISLAGGYLHIFYILSLHPEIIAKDEFKRFLRQIEQKIKLGLVNVETRIKDKDKTGLQIIEGEYGKQIWYKDTNEGSDEDQKKKIDYVNEKFYTPLFDEKASDYCGITKQEFEGSTEILKRIEDFLETKPRSSAISQHAKEEEEKPSWFKRYAWSIIVGIFELSILLAILDIADTKVSSLIIIGLALVYLQIKGTSLGLSLLYPRIIEGLNNEFIQIRKILGDKNLMSSDELCKLIKNLRTQEKKTYVQIGFQVLMNFIVILKLLSLVLS